MKLVVPISLCLSVVVAMGLSTCTPVSPVADGGADAEPDVLSDVTTDTRPVPDVVQPDVPVDGGSEDPGWVPLPGMPARCAIERAEHPERLMNVEWLSCGEGCEYLGPDTRYHRIISADGSRFEDGVGFFTIIMGDADVPVTSARRIVALADTTGRFWGAWRAPRPNSDVVCAVYSVVAGSMRVFVDIDIWTDDERQHRIYSAALSDVRDVSEPIVVLDETIVPPGAVLRRPQASDSLFAAELSPAAHLLLVRPDGEFEMQRIGTAQHVNVVGDDVIFEAAREEDGQLFRIMMRTRFGEEPTVLLDAPDGHIAGARASADGITWHYARTEGGLGTADHIELWTSPFATERASLEPRLVRNLVPELNDFYTVQQNSGGGYWVGNAELTHFIRLSDGATFYARPYSEGPAGTTAYLWVGEEEIAIAGTLTGFGVSQGSLIRFTSAGLRPI